MDPEFARDFAAEWEQAWNAHDVDRLLGHYSDDVIFQSPYAAHRFAEPTGEVRGKDALRHYFASGLGQQPGLRFSVESVRLAVDTVVINYRNQDGHGISEVLRFREGLVCWGCGAYEPGAALAATASLSS